MTNVATRTMLILRLPVHITLELTSECNNHCMGCGNIPSLLTQGTLSASEWKRIIDAIAPHTLRLRLSGGEPAMHPEFDAIIQIIERKNIPFAIFTNGRWRHPKQMIERLRKLKQCRKILFSLHGADAGVHDTFTGVEGSFAETVRNIREAAQNGLPIATSTIIHRRNWNTIEDMIRFLDILGVRQSTFTRYAPVRDIRPLPENFQLKQAVSIIEKHRRQGRRIDYSLCIPHCFTPSGSMGCLSGAAYCVIDPLGNVRPCSHADIECGNLLDHPLEAIWNGERMTYWRGLIPKDCFSCDVFSECRGGCRAVAQLGPTGKDPLITHPIRNKTQNAPPMVLYGKAYPRSLFSIHPQPFGYLLSNNNRLAPVSSAAKPILDELDGGSSLNDIYSAHGQDAIDFIGQLYRKGLVELLETQSDRKT